MAALTHVCMWTEKGWRKITAWEASKMHPYGTVSARSGFFMCDLCGQYVTLTSGSIREPYFKHSSSETSKDCPERSVNAYYSYTTTQIKQNHDLPLRMKLLGNGKVAFELGFTPLPTDIKRSLNKSHILINGIHSNIQSESFTFSFQRIQEDNITYLQVGGTPAKRYDIAVNTDKNDVWNYWTRTVPGIAEDGTLFDGITKKRIPDDSDVVVGKTYYLIGCFSDYRMKTCEGLSYSSSGRISFRYRTWGIYEIKATKYCEDTVRFFLDYHARLTEYPIEVIPLWPEFVNSPYRILHKESKLFFYIQGERVRTHLFPISEIRQSSIADNQSLVLVNCKERQELLSTGRVRTLNYVYLWKHHLGFEQPMPKIEVLDWKGEAFEEGSYNSLPIRGTLLIKCEYDGTLEINNKAGILIRKLNINADQQLLVDEIEFDCTVFVYVSCDCIWKATFIRANKKKQINEAELVNKLSRYIGRAEITVSHAEMAAIAIKLEDYPLLKTWLLQQVRCGKISKYALSEICKTVRKGHNNDR